MDTASLLIRFVVPGGGPPNDRITVFSQNDECHKCSLLPVAEIPQNTNKTIAVQTQFPTSFSVVRNNNEVCKFGYMFNEAASYTLVVSSKSGGNVTTCSAVQEVTPSDNAFLRTFHLLACCYNSFFEILNGRIFNNPTTTTTAILIAFAVFAAVALVWMAGKWLFIKYNESIRNFFSYQQFVTADLGVPATINNAPAESDGDGGQPKKQRLRSLDTFRGLSLTIMIFVNYGGGGYWFFNHSIWNGLTVADLVFPWFVWIMGAALAFSFRGPLQRDEPQLKLFGKIVRRTVILFIFGLIINTDSCQPVALSNLRIMGVLQRLAISYFFVATLELVFGKTAMTMPASDGASTVNSARRFFYDILGSFPQWIFVAVIVTVHTCITFLLPVPDCPKGYLGPGGIADDGQYYNCTGGAAQYVDKVILGESHMYQNPTCKGLYHTVIPYDPEGLLGCLTSITMCYLGLHAGRILTLYPTTTGRLARWLNWAVIWGVVAGFLCGFSQHDGVIPINKNLWSLSFILALSSMALVLLTCLYLICDVFHLWSGAPFVYPGMNSIVVYMCHEVLHNVFPVSFAVDNNHLQRLAIDLWGVSLWTVVAAVMYHYEVFIAI